MKNGIDIVDNKKSGKIIAFLLVLLIGILILTLGTFSQTQQKWERKVREYNSLTKNQEVINESN